MRPYVALNLTIDSETAPVDSESSETVGWLLTSSLTAPNKGEAAASPSLYYSRIPIAATVDFLNVIVPLLRGSLAP